MVTKMASDFLRSVPDNDHDVASARTIATDSKSLDSTSAPARRARAGYRVAWPRMSESHLYFGPIEARQNRGHWCAHLDSSALGVRGGDLGSGHVTTATDSNQSASVSRRIVLSLALSRSRRQRRRGELYRQSRLSNAASPLRRRRGPSRMDRSVTHR